MTVVWFFLIALLYSSAGFGGGSLYLAVLSQSAMSAAALKFTALSCNALVTANGTWQFHKQGWLPWKKVWPLLAFSVPACVATSMFPLQQRWYLLTLGACLLLAAAAMLMQTFKQNSTKPSMHQRWIFPAAAVTGALAGLTGIGGGVYLSPVLHLSRWGNPKEIAGTSAAFILINSLVGLTVQGLQGHAHVSWQWGWLMLAVFAGGILGSFSSSAWFSQANVRRLTMFVLIFASIRIILRNV